MWMKISRLSCLLIAIFVGLANQCYPFVRWIIVCGRFEDASKNQERLGRLGLRICLFRPVFVRLGEIPPSGVLVEKRSYVVAR